jgi:hypothetical protein
MRLHRVQRVAVQRIKRGAERDIRRPDQGDADGAHQKCRREDGHDAL